MRTLFLVCAIISSPAQAGILDDDVRDLDLPCIVYDSDNYIGFGVGKSQPSALNHTATSKQFSTGDIYFGHRLSQKFAVEAKYVSLGSFFNATTSETTIVDNYSLSMVFKYGVDEERYFSIFGRAGYGASVLNLVPVGRAWHGDLTYGLGVELTLSPATQRVWYLRMSADKFNTGSLTQVSPGGYAPKDSVANYSVSLLFNF